MRQLFGSCEEEGDGGGNGLRWPSLPGPSLSHDWTNLTSTFNTVAGTARGKTRRDGGEYGLMAALIAGEV